MPGTGPVKRFGDFRLQDHVEGEEVARKCSGNVFAEPRASGCSSALSKNPHEMGSKKGNVKIRLKATFRK